MVGGGWVGGVIPIITIYFIHPGGKLKLSFDRTIDTELNTICKCGGE